jgi:hypothetical protein
MAGLPLEDGSSVEATLNLTELKAARFKLLNHYYDLTGGDPYKWNPPQAVGAELGYDEQTSLQLAEYLKNEGLLKYWAMGPQAGITHQGVKEIEAARSEPEKPTRYFPPVNVIHVGGNVVHSAFQQASPEAQQTLEINEARTQDVLAALAQIKTHIDDLGLTAQAKTDLQVDVATVEAQMKASRPKGAVITECFRSIRNIVEGTVGGLAASGILAAIAKVLGG